jgi:hypothetical protein
MTVTKRKVEDYNYSYRTVGEMEVYKEPPYRGTQHVTGVALKSRRERIVSSISGA